VATAPQFCGLLPPPERNDALAAIARTIGMIRRRYGLTAKDIARSLKRPDGESPNSDTIERAERGENLLSFDLIAQMAFIYGDCADPVRALLQPVVPPEPTTLEERLQRAEQEILAVRRELTGGDGA
jgi:transcriptional regulator with XRE-family HTH domain